MTRPRSYLLPLLTAVCTLLAAIPTSAAAVREVTYSHAGVNADWQTSVQVEPGEVFKLKITDTCPAAFEIENRPIPRAGGPSRPGVGAAGACSAPGTKEISIVHEATNSGYIVNLTRQQQGPITVPFGGFQVPVRDVTLVISVPESSWDYELAGAFTLSDLTDPAFGLEMRDVEGEQKPFVIRDEGAEDDVNPGAGAFIHVFHRRLRPLALTFGLGVSEQTAPTYYTGLSWRWGGKGAFTAGYAWGAVDRLPSGTRFDTPVDAGLLGNLQQRLEGAWFFGVSYPFLDTGNKLLKNFTTRLNVVDSAASTSPAATAPQAASPAPAATGLPLPQAPAWITDRPKIEDKTVLLAWTPVQGAVEYEVLRSTVDCDDEQPALIARSTSTSYTDSGVEAGISYYYTLRTVGPSGTSRRSVCKPVEVPEASGG